LPLRDELAEYIVFCQAIRIAQGMCIAHDFSFGRGPDEEGWSDHGIYKGHKDVCSP
jgi:hypothetical protein